jgi:hypothetical protein
MTDVTDRPKLKVTEIDGRVWIEMASLLVCLDSAIEDLHGQRGGAATADYVRQMRQDVELAILRARL